MHESENAKIVVIGGGTGSFTLLSSLKYYVRDLTALVNMADDGGSTGELRDQYGVLPPGDVRQCLVALSDSPRMRDLFSFRFPSGSMQGHSFGNLFLSALEIMSDDFEEAIEAASEVLRIHGRVIPVTTTKSKLMLKEQSGNIISGEHKIELLRFTGSNRPLLYLDPVATLTESGRKAIEEADMVVIAPGNLYGSLVAALTVEGMREALMSTKAKITYVCNLVTKPYQTDGFMVHDYVSEIERFVGRQFLDYVLYNTDTPPPALLAKYTHDGEKLVGFDLDVLEDAPYRAIGLPLIDTERKVDAAPGDAIASTRNLIRHDARAVSRRLMSLYFENPGA
jgi:uncharacterized cofD-like protein